MIRVGVKNLDDVSRALGFGADKKIMNAKLAGLTTQELKILTNAGSIQVASRDWHHTNAVIQILGIDHALLGKVLQAGLSIQEVRKLSEEGALTEDGLDTIIAIQGRSHSPFAETADKKQKPLSMKEKLKQASSKMAN